MADDYEGRAAFTGDRDAALARTGRLLADAGFQVLPPAGNQLHFENPVSFLKPNKQPLLMVSRGSVSVIGQELVLNAEFGNLRSWLRFSGFTTVAATVLLLVVFAAAQDPKLLWACLAVILPAPVLLPIWSKIQTRGTERALGALLARAAEGN